MIPIFVLNNHFPATSGAKFGSPCGSPSHNPFHVVGMAQERHFSESFLPQTSSDLCLSFRKSIFQEVIHGLFTFNAAPFNSTYFLSLIADQFPKFGPGESISLHNLTLMISKVSLQNFVLIFVDSVFLTSVRPEPGIVILRCDQMVEIFQLFPWGEYFAPELNVIGPISFSPGCILILSALLPKILIRSFWPACDGNPETVILRCNQMGQISEFFLWREYFAAELYACEPKRFPSRIFSHFGRPTAKNFDLVFLTGVRPKVPSFQIFPLKRVFRSITWRWWSRKFPVQNFILTFVALPPEISIQSFLPTWDQNLGSPFWGATKRVKFPNFSLGQCISLQNLTPVVL